MWGEVVPEKEGLGERGLDLPWGWVLWGNDGLSLVPCEAFDVLWVPVLLCPPSWAPPLRDGEDPWSLHLHAVTTVEVDVNPCWELPSPLPETS